MGQEFSLQPMQGELQQAFEKMPSGWYRAVVTKAEVKETQDNSGIGLEISFKILDGPSKDRVHKQWYNRKNANQQTVDIATRHLNTLAGCMNLWAGIQNTDQFLNIPVQIKLGDKKDNPDYNDIKAYRDINGNDPVKPGTAVAQPGTVATAVLATPATPAAPAAPAAPVAPAAPAAPVVQHDPRAVAQANGWKQHPDNADYAYTDAGAVKPWAEVAAMYPAPAPAAPAAPAIPPAAPAAPAIPGAPAYTAPATYAAPAQPGAPPVIPYAQPGATSGQEAAWKP